MSPESKEVYNYYLGNEVLWLYNQELYLESNTPTCGVWVHVVPLKNCKLIAIPTENVIVSIRQLHTCD